MLSNAKESDCHGDLNMHLILEKHGLLRFFYLSALGCHSEKLLHVN